MASVTPYGYLKDENDGNHWIVDEEAAEIVRQSVEVLNRHDKEIKQIDTRMDKLTLVEE